MVHVLSVMWTFDCACVECDVDLDCTCVECDVDL